MIAGGNWWRANEIVIRHLTRRTATRYRSRDKAAPGLTNFIKMRNKRPGWAAAGRRSSLGPYCSDVGRPSIDPELMMRMLIVGYCFGIRSERRLCDEVHLNLAYRWFCRWGLDGEVPDHSTFSKNRHGRFRESDLLRKLFETVVARCMRKGSSAARRSRLMRA
jgi:hypothetical protein